MLRIRAYREEVSTMAARFALCCIEHFGAPARPAGDRGADYLEVRVKYTHQAGEAAPEPDP